MACDKTERNRGGRGALGAAHLSCASITPSLRTSPRHRLLLEQSAGRLGTRALILAQCRAARSWLFNPFETCMVAASTRTSSRTHVLTGFEGNACTPRMHAAEISCSTSSSESVSICNSEEEEVLSGVPSKQLCGRIRLAPLFLFMGAAPTCAIPNKRNTQLN